MRDQDITDIIILLLNTTWRAKNPRLINSGDCNIFAAEVCKLLDKQIWFKWMPGVPHAAIEFNGKWFDAEAPEGKPYAEHPYVIRYNEGMKDFIRWTKKALNQL